MLNYRRVLRLFFWWEKWLDLWQDQLVVAPGKHGEFLIWWKDCSLWVHVEISCWLVAYLTVREVWTWTKVQVYQVISSILHHVYCIYIDKKYVNLLHIMTSSTTWHDCARIGRSIPSRHTTGWWLLFLSVPQARDDDPPKEFAIFQRFETIVTIVL